MDKFTNIQQHLIAGHQVVLIFDSELYSQINAFREHNPDVVSGKLQGFLSVDTNIAFVIKCVLPDQELIASDLFQQLYAHPFSFDFDCKIFFYEDSIISEDVSLLWKPLNSSENESFLTAILPNQSQSIPVQTQILNFEGDLFSRVQGIFDTNLIKDFQVAIFGLGSGGSFVAIELAKCGINHFALFDFDRLEIQNISRHVCTLKDLGRLKTDAVGDLILSINPRADITKFTFDIAAAENRAIITEVVANSDALVMATDSENSRFLINEIALQTLKPLFYAGAYDRGKGGEILRIIPGETACYGCLNEYIGRLSETLLEKKKVDYSVTPIASGKVEAVPGLSVDVAFIALFQTKMILTYLIHLVKPDYPDIEENLIVWGNTKFPGVFEKPLVIAKSKLTPHPNCTVCHGTGHLPSDDDVPLFDLSQVETSDWNNEDEI